MEINNAIQIVKTQLRKERFEHTIRVLDTAEELANRFDAPVEEVKLAAVFHDYAKHRPLDELKSGIISSDLPMDLLDYHSELWHGPIGAILVEREQGITDKNILSAIHYHTTGKADMNKIEMIVYLADYIEPGREFKGLDEVRKASKSDLQYACWIVARNTINHLIRKEATVYPDSIHAYNDFTRIIKRRDKSNG